jgi:hypothetical protein
LENIEYLGIYIKRRNSWVTLVSLITDKWDIDNPLQDQEIDMFLEDLQEWPTIYKFLKFYVVLHRYKRILPYMDESL